ncbi:MAG: ABC transporter ATP-binding protein [Herpetosiphonaceae bacterium]|nr:ABC transporter ATP-binding protein [Herpetosiphonaceae bacterium]
MKLSMIERWSFLVTYLKPQQRRVLLLGALLLISIALQLANPLVLRYFIDTAQAGGATRSLILAALLFIGVALVNQLFSVAATYVSENVGWTATNLLRADLLRHCLHLDLAFHKARTPGELIDRIDGDVNALATFFSDLVIKVFGNALLLIGVLIVLWAINWQVGIILTALAVVMLIVLLRVQSIAVPHWKASRQTSAELFGFLEERLAGTEDIRASGAVAYTMHRLYELMRIRLRAERKAFLIGSFIWLTPVLFAALTIAITFVVSARLFHQSVISLGTAYVIFFYAQIMLRPIRIITRQMEDLQKATAGMLRIQELYQFKATIIDGHGDSLPSGPLELAFEQVAFGYEVDDHVLHAISFAILPGRTLGILGRTGSGKTTLTRLLFRLYDPTAGTICLGGTDIRTVPVADLRRRIGMVTQDVHLFQASLRDNLTFFDDTLPDARIMTVLTDLGLLPWFHALPAGLDSILASGSGGLSSGEAQVLALTRIFLRDPGLVVLDEASSRLDPATEQLVERAVGSLLHNRTGIVIAHRLHTVLRADDILILEDGQICEYGPRDRLMADPKSRFSQLLRTGLEEVLT